MAHQALVRAAPASRVPGACQSTEDRQWVPQGTVGLLRSQTQSTRHQLTVRSPFGLGFDPPFWSSWSLVVGVLRVRHRIHITYVRAEAD